MFRLFISEILDKVSKLSTDEEKVMLLKENDNISFKQVLYHNYSQNIVFALPKTAATFKPNRVPIGIADTNLYREARKLYLFVEGGKPLLNQQKRERLWEGMLEMLQYQEAEVLENLKNKNFEARYNLSRKVVETAFPGLLEPAGLQKPATETSAVTGVPQVPVKRGRGRPKKVKAEGSSVQSVPVLPTKQTTVDGIVNQIPPEIAFTKGE